MAIVVVLPLAQLLVEQVNVVADAVAIQELVELLIVDAMRAVDFPVQMWRPGANVDVTDVALLEMPVKLGLKLRAIVGSGRRAREMAPKDLRR
jgi:hypothetical protein